MGIFGHTGHYNEEPNPFLECPDYKPRTPKEFNEEYKNIDREVRQLFAERVEQLLYRYPSFVEIENLMSILQSGNATQSELHQIIEFCTRAQDAGFMNICSALRSLGVERGISEERILELQVMIFFGLGNSMNYLHFSDILKRYLELVPNGMQRISSLLKVTEKDLFASIEQQLEKQSLFDGDNYIVMRDHNMISERGYTINMMGKISLERELSSTEPDMDEIRRIITIFWEYDNLWMFERTYDFNAEIYSKMINQYSFDDPKTSEEKKYFYSEVAKLPSDFLRHITLLEEFQKSYLRVYLNSLRSTKSNNNI